MRSLLPLNTLPGFCSITSPAYSGPRSTFYSQRVFDLFPQMATTNSGWSTHVAEGNNVFGSDIRTDNTNDSDYIEWTVYVPAGNYKVCAQHTKTNATGRADLAIDGGSVVDTLDTYNGSTAYNQKWTSAQFTVTEGLHTIRLTKNGKHASSTGYIVAITHVQLIKQDATSALTSVANVPHVINVPVVFADSHTNWNTLSMNTAWKFGTVLASSGAQNATVTLSFWGPKGAFTLAFSHLTFTNKGIYTVAVDGNTLGTVDGYAASDLPNILDTSLTGIFASTGMHTITFTMATKHASSSAYYGAIQHIQIRMTSITEPLAADLAPEVALFWPVFAPANTNWSVVTVSASQAYYYYRQNNSGVNSEITLSTDTVLLPGAYRLDIHTMNGSNYGTFHLLVDGSDVGNADAYAASPAFNQLEQVTGVALTGFGPKTIKLKISDKNASSGGYANYITLARLIRTGA